jgi:hypothetical protein
MIINIIIFGKRNVENGMWKTECGKRNVENGMWKTECGKRNVFNINNGI